MRTYRMLFAVMMGTLIAACGEVQLADHFEPAEEFLGNGEGECPFPTSQEVCGVDGECFECGWSPVPDLVCGADGRTYLNAEQAECLGVGIRHEGGCGDCIVPQVDAPVCGADGKTYINAFAAACYDVEVLFEGHCEGWVCTADWSPVCGEDGKTYSNECVAVRLNHTRVAHIGACGCECEDVYEPVCVGVVGEGTYPNACLARCSGVTITHEGPCEDVTALD